MMKKISKYFNIYVVIVFIAITSFFYMFSFAFVLNDVSSGSSRAMKKKLCKEKPEVCYVSPKKSTNISQ